MSAFLDSLFDCFLAVPACCWRPAEVVECSSLGLSATEAAVLSGSGSWSSPLVFAWLQQIIGLTLTQLITGTPAVSVLDYRAGTVMDSEEVAFIIPEGYWSSAVSSPGPTHMIQCYHLFLLPDNWNSCHDVKTLIASLLEFIAGLFVFLRETCFQQSGYETLMHILTLHSSWFWLWRFL